MTEVVPERPPIWPTMSLAWMTRTYWSRVSRSMLGRAVLITPGKKKKKKRKDNNCDSTYIRKRFYIEYVEESIMPVPEFLN